jgi:hypothetical protein
VPRYCRQRREYRYSTPGQKGASPVYYKKKEYYNNITVKEGNVYSVLEDKEEMLAI